jgi:hypothetical protein
LGRHPPAAQVEFCGILRPPGWVVLAWNERLIEGPFLEAYEAVLDRYAPEYRQVDHRRMDAGVMDQFFGAGRWKQADFPNQQRFDMEGLLATPTTGGPQARISRPGPCFRRSLPNPTDNPGCRAQRPSLPFDQPTLSISCPIIPTVRASAPGSPLILVTIDLGGESLRV